jgi:hypothetical protein
MAAHLLVLYPQPTDQGVFAKAYREEHLPYAGPRLTGATGVSSLKVVGPDKTPPFHFVTDVSFPDIETLQRCAQSTGGQEALAHAASISSGGAPMVFGAVDAD